MINTVIAAVENEGYEYVSHELDGVGPRSVWRVIVWDIDPDMMTHTKLALYMDGAFKIIGLEVIDQ